MDGDRSGPVAGEVPLEWVGSSLKDLSESPPEMKQDIGYALYQAQIGEKGTCAKPLKGFGGAGVLEVVDDFDGDTFRAVATVKFKGVIYVLRAFEKKSTEGGKTSKGDVDLVNARMKLAEADDERRQKEKSDAAK